MSDVSWDELYTESDPETCYNLLHETLFSNFNAICPEKTIKVRNKSVAENRWYVQELGDMKMRLDALYVMATSMGDETSWKAYTTYKKQYKASVRKQRQMSVEQRIESSDNKLRTIWKIIKEELNAGKQINTKKSNLKPDDLNNFFIDSTNRVAQNMTTNGSGPEVYLNGIQSPSESLFMLPVTTAEVMKATKQIKAKNTQDIYGFSTRMLHRTIPYVLDPLTHVIDTCFKNGHFPEKLKTASITPVHKKGDTNKESNYRPISILPAISKIFEQIMKTRITNFLISRGSLSENQHGFLGGRSTTTALFQIVEQVMNAFNEERTAQLTMLDLSKAFDLVDHEMLLAKLHHGIRGLSNQLLRSYLTGRSQRVKWNGGISEERMNGVGVAQGSIIGPILFVVFMNDLPIGVEEPSVCQYADDTSFLTVAKDEIDVVEKATSTNCRMNRWFQSNRLQVNKDKTQKILFHTKKRPNDTTSNFLGIHLDSTLSFSEHICILAKKLSRAIFCIRRIRMLGTYQATRLTYFAAFQSHLTYGLLVWGSAEISSIFILQKRALRVLTGAKQRDHCRTLFKQQKIMTLPSLYILTVLTYMYKNVAEFSKNNETHDYNTRRALDLRIPQCRIRKTQQSANYWGVRLFNVVSDATRSLPEALFKKKIKEHLLGAAYYSVEEFLQENIIL